MKPVRFLLNVPGSSAGRAISLAVSSGGPAPSQETRAPVVWAEHSEHIINLGDRGIVVGYLFARETGQRRFALPIELVHAPEPAQIASWLTRNCWGAYAALLRDGPNLYVYPDPSGLLPVYRIENADRWLCTGDLPLLGHLYPSRPRVSWSQLGAHLQQPEWRGPQTCLEAIDELPAGQLTCLTSSERQPLAMWQPSQFMPQRPNRPFDELAAELRATAQKVMRAWSSVSGRMLVAASGGVDSSLIAAALSTTGQDFACLTVATTDPSGDERVPVRQLAGHLGVEMFEEFYDARCINLAAPASLDLPRPSGKAFMQEVRRATRQAGEAFRADVLFDGNGGDNLFCYLHSSVPILDRWRCEGISRGLAETVLDMCRITQSTIPSMMHAIALRARRGMRPAAWHADRRLLARGLDQWDVQAALDDLAQTVPREHPGKVDHLGLLLRTQNFVHPATGSANPMQFSPLMSQPLVELCLSIPTWLWCRGGVNRAVARAAFAQDLPSAIVRRVSKAGPDSAMREIFTRNRALVREMLLDGLLMANGLLDAPAIEQALAADPHGQDPIIYRLLALVEAEAWARSWQ